MNQAFLSKVSGDWEGLQSKTMICLNDYTFLLLMIKASIATLYKYSERLVATVDSNHTQQGNTMLRTLDERAIVAPLVSYVFSRRGAEFSECVDTSGTYVLIRYSLTLCCVLHAQMNTYTAWWRFDV